MELTERLVTILVFVIALPAAFSLGVFLAFKSYRWLMPWQVVRKADVIELSKKDIEYLRIGLSHYVDRSFYSCDPEYHEIDALDGRLKSLFHDIDAQNAQFAQNAQP